MKEKQTINCEECGKHQVMYPITGLSKTIQEGKIGDDGLWHLTGERSEILYQCPTCKSIKVD